MKRTKRESLKRGDLVIWDLKTGDIDIVIENGHIETYFDWSVYRYEEDEDREEYEDCAKSFEKSTELARGRICRHS